MEDFMIYIIIYFAAVNVIAFAMMGADKHRAVKGRWRISEKALFISALIGGCAGANLGMHIFRHKTKHIKFVVGMPLILAAWIAAGAGIIINFL